MKLAALMAQTTFAFQHRALLLRVPSSHVQVAFASGSRSKREHSFTLVFELIAPDSLTPTDTSSCDVFSGSRGSNTTTLAAVPCKRTDHFVPIQIQPCLLIPWPLLTSNPITTTGDCRSTYRYYRRSRIVTRTSTSTSISAFTSILTSTTRSMRIQ